MNKSKPRRKEDEEETGGASKPISFHPVPFEEALDALLATPPEPKSGHKKPMKKRTAKKAGKK